MPPPPAPALVVLGVFGAAHGVRGEIRVKSYTADPAAIATYGALTDGRGRSFELVAVRPLKDDMLVARVKGVADRTAAEALTNVRLHVPRAALGEAAEEDEFFHADLVGLKAETDDGAPFGIVVGLFDFGSGDLLEIKRDEARQTVFLPFTKAVVPVIDLAGGRIVVAPPAEIEDEGPREAFSPRAERAGPPRRRGLPAKG